MSSVHPITVGLTASSIRHDPENLGYRALERLVIFRIVQLLHRHDDIDIVEDSGSEGTESRIGGADAASNHDNQSTHGDTRDPLSYEEKVERLVDAIMSGRRLRFSPSTDNNGCTVYAMRSPHTQEVEEGKNTEEVDKAGSADGLEQHIASNPENFGRVITNPRRSMTPHPTGSVSRGLSPDEFQSILDWNAEVTASSEDSSDDGRILVVMGQAGIEYRTISPIPLDFHRIRTALAATPSISSHGSELDCSSPSFAKTCKAIFKQSLLEAPSPVQATTLLHQSSIKKHRGRASLPDIGSDPGDRGVPGNPEDFHVWEDISSNGSTGDKIQQILPNANALRDTTNLRKPGYLRYNSFYQNVKAKAEAILATDVPGPVSTPQYGSSAIKPPNSNASSTNSLFAAYEDSERAASFATALAALEGVVISDSPAPPPPSSIFPPSLDPARAAQFEKALAALEGRIDPAADTLCPVQRFVRPTGHYNSNVLVENSGPRLRHPKPSQTFNAGAVLEKMEEAIIDRIEDIRVVPRRRLIRRPANPTPLRARYHYGEGSLA